MLRIIRITCLFLCITLAYSLCAELYVVNAIDALEESSVNQIDVKGKGFVDDDCKILSEATIDQKFTDNHVIVVLNKSVGSLNKQHDHSLFGSLSLKSIKDLTSLRKITQQDLNSNEIKTAVEQWNGISSNVSFTCVRLSEVTPDMNVIATMASVKLTNLPDDHPFYAPYTNGRQGVAGLVTVINSTGEHYVNRESESGPLNQDINQAIIYIALQRIAPDVAGEEGKGASVIIHEVGHALKLRHPANVYEEKTFPRIMAPNTNYLNGVTYIESLQSQASWAITNYDRDALITKWGE